MNTHELQDVKSNSRSSASIAPTGFSMMIAIKMSVGAMSIASAVTISVMVGSTRAT